MTTWSTAFPQSNSTITTNNTILGPFDVTPFSNAVIGFSGTYAGVTVNFEGSVDGVTWFAINAAPVAGGGVAPGSVALATNAIVAYDVLLGPLTSFRVRSSAYTSGTATVVLSLGNAMYDPAPGTVTGGDTASGAADSGNPVKIGAVYHAVPPTLSDGQRTDLTSDNRQSLRVTLFGNNTNTATIAQATGDANGGSGILSGSSYGYNGASWDRARFPAMFKTVSATASGNTALWTPSAGKKFRLMRILFDLTSNISRAAAAVTTFSLQDSATDMGITFDVFVPTAAVVTGFGGYNSGWIDLGNGFLSSAANNVLNINLSAALATGVSRITCCGTEE